MNQESNTTMNQESNLHHKEHAISYKQANYSSERQDQKRHEEIAQLSQRLRRMKRRLLLEVAEEQSSSQQALNQLSIPFYDANSESFSSIEE
jgi:hypothetical protein